MPPEYAGFERYRIGNALVYHSSIQLDPFGGERRLSITFPGRPSRAMPIVMASGPVQSRHRFTVYRPASLCLWYAGDHESMRWTLQDGLVRPSTSRAPTIGREAYWRETGRWEGPEVHSPPNPNGHSRTDECAVLGIGSASGGIEHRIAA